MTQVLKTVTGYIVFAGLESNYGAGAALTGSVNTIQCAGATVAPHFDVAYSYDGSRKGAMMSAGQNQYTTPSGRTVTGKLSIEGKGLGLAYNTSATGSVPNLHPFIIASGFSASLNAGAWKYVPTPLNVTQQSVAMEVYGRYGGGAGGEKLPISGGFAKMSFQNDGAGITTFDFDIMGIPADQTDAVLAPSRSFQAVSVLPPKNELINLTIGAYSANVRSYNYTHNPDIQPRVNLNASGSHSGFVMGRRAPSFKVTIEADAFGNYNPLSDWKNATTRTVTATIGSATANSFTFTMNQASIASVKQGEDGTVGTYDIEFVPSVTGPDTNDDIVLQFNA